MEESPSDGQGVAAVPSVTQDATLQTSDMPQNQPPPTDSTSANSNNDPVGAAQNGNQGTSAPPPTTTQVAPEVALQAADASASESNQAQSADENMTDPGAPIYGTRSRHRTGANRPNYAEDQDNMDFEYNAPQKSESKRNQSATDGKQQDAAGLKFVSVNETGQTEKPAPKDASSGISTSAAAPTKKRKAATSSNTNTRDATPTATNAIVPPRRLNNTPSASTGRETNIMTFAKSKAVLKNGKLVADDGTALSINDHVYLVCEPPGEPYYLCRIMEFLHTKSGDPSSPIDSLRVNWYYRPRDVQRYNNDTRLVYGTMHSDMCPLTSLRGKCEILHRSEIDDLDEYRKRKDSFWFSQIHDRFIKRFYEVIPTSQIINVPEKVKKALDERWKFIAVEVGRVKELTSAVKLCKRCSGYCASHDSVECAICSNTYHMNCVRPPLPKKPSRGFAWACGPCGRAQEKRLEARHTSGMGTPTAFEEEEIIEEEEEDPAQGDSTRAPSPDSEMQIDQHPGTQAEIALAKMWPMRYLGIHCRVEDALQYDDRAIYPRASSRLGPRHQANVNVWHGRPVELVKAAEIKKKYVKTSSHKKDAKLSKETIAALEADRVERAKRPKWVLDEPVGYVHRGEDYDNDDPRNTARLMFKLEEPYADHSRAANEEFVDNYMKRARGLAKALRVAEFSVNFQDKCLQLLIDAKYNAEDALAALAKVDRSKDLKEPIFALEDLKKFEDGVAKYGSEHRLIKQHMKTSLPIWAIIRFYYLWKKTPRGKQIWDNYGGRKGTKKKVNVDAATKIQAEVADDGDDSAFDGNKAASHKREFQCKFCSVKHSRQWRRAPGVSPGQMVPVDGKATGKDKTNRPLLALCLRCASLWRRYAIQWEEADEIAKKVAQGGGRAWKRRIDEELLRELMEANELASNGTPEAAGTPAAEAGSEPPKKKAKTAESKKPVAKLPTPPPPPIVPDLPKLRPLPCAICKKLENSGQQPITCTHCKLTVHKQCFGLADQNLPIKWVCDQCSNDRNPSISTHYSCTLCPIEFTPIDLWEQPKVSHKKKTDRDREKERLEKELMDKARSDYINRQLELSRPVEVREPLKKTDGNNWVHATCAIWTPEIKFSNAKALEKAEGFSTIPLAKYESICKLCKSSKGACTSCLQCHATFHVACAAEAGNIFGFDVTPVKGSRKDTITTVTMGQETGYLTAAVWCRDHVIKTIVHPMDEVVDEETGKTALQLYVENYKQADQTLTGTARKANLLSQSTRTPMQPYAAAVAAVNRRISVVSAATAGPGRKGRNSIASTTAKDDDVENGSPAASTHVEASERKCVSCGVDVSPRWYQTEKKEKAQVHIIDQVVDGHRPLMNGTAIKTETNGEVPRGAQSEGEVAPEYECHKCHLGAYSKPKPVSLSPPRQYPVQMDWAGQLLGPTQGQPEQQYRPDQPLHQAGLLPHMGSQLPRIDHQHQAPPHQSGSFPPPQPIQPNGLSYGQSAPPPQRQYPPVGGQYYHQQRQGPPPPLNNLPPASQHLPNGVASPQYPQQSPTYLAGHPPHPPPQQQYPATRSTESPYMQPQQAPPQAASQPGPFATHASPPLPHVRPTTPRESSIDPRVPGGASASPSLRNLLH